MGPFPILLVGCSFSLPLCSHSTSSLVSFIKLSPGFLLSSLGFLLCLPFNFYLAVKCWEFLKPDSRSPLFLNLYFPCLWFQWSLTPTWLIYIFNPFALWRFWTVYGTALSVSPIEIPLYIQHIQNWRHGLPYCLLTMPYFPPVDLVNMKINLHPIIYLHPFSSLLQAFYH